MDGCVFIVFCVGAYIAAVAGALHELAVADGAVVEVGGTSSNISLIQSGRPRLAYVRIGERATALLSQPTLDRAAIEAFRVEQMALADTASKRFAQAVADVSEVLTADQRRKVSEFIERKRGYWKGWHRG